jgi:hypothetical protein
MFTRRYELEWFDVWWHGSSHKCRAGKATCMKRSKQDDINRPLDGDHSVVWQSFHRTRTREKESQSQYVGDFRWWLPWIARQWGSDSYNLHYRK